MTLRADCGDCFALCCVAPAFAKSVDFAVDKPAGTPCRNLLDDFRCGIHTSLRSTGFRGCTVYDCYGAGQKVSQQTFGGRDWRSAPESASAMFGSLTVMRALHELLYYLAEALTLPAATSVHAELRRIASEIEALSDLPADTLPTSPPTGCWSSTLRRTAARRTTCCDAVPTCAART